MLSILSNQYAERNRGGKLLFTENLWLSAEVLGVNIEWPSIFDSSASQMQSSYCVTEKDFQIVFEIYSTILFPMIILGIVVVDGFRSSAFLQVTSVSKKGEKFKLFVGGVLEAFAFQLEIASFGEVGNVSAPHNCY